MLRKILKIGLTIAVLAWATVVVMDYLNVSNKKQPKFCISKVEHKYDDGITTECTGLGYKAFMYDRGSITAGEFGFFGMKEKQPEDFKNVQ